MKRFSSYLAIQTFTVLILASAARANGPNLVCSGESEKGGAHFSIIIKSSANGALAGKVTEITGEVNSDDVVSLIPGGATNPIYRQVGPSRHIGGVKSALPISRLEIFVTSDWKNAVMNISQSALGLKDVVAHMTCD